MKSMLSKLRLLFYAPVVGLILLFGPLPLQNVSAQSMNMDTDHNLAGVESGISSCGPCAAGTVTNLPEKQKLIINHQEQDPEPPERLPFYAQNPQFPEPQKPANNYAFGGALLRPPDLVKLYANFRF